MPSLTNLQRSAHDWVEYSPAGLAADQDLLLEVGSGPGKSKVYPSGVLCGVGGLLKLKNAKGVARDINAIAGVVYPIQAGTLVKTGTLADKVLFLYNA